MLIGGMREKGRGWGRFDVRLSGRHPVPWVAEYLMKSALPPGGIAAVTKGSSCDASCSMPPAAFPIIALMVNIAISRLLKRQGAVAGYFRAGRDIGMR